MPVPTSPHDRPVGRGRTAGSAATDGERAARPKRIYPLPAIPLTEVGKPYKPALAADAAARATAEALASAAVPASFEVSAAHEDGQLVVTVTGADPGEVRAALAGYAFAVRTRPQVAESNTDAPQESEHRHAGPAPRR